MPERLGAYPTARALCDLVEGLLAQGVPWLRRAQPERAGVWRGWAAGGQV